MKRPLLIVLLALVVGAALLAASYQLAARLCAKQMATNADDLAWLRQEFHLNEAELARVRTLHDGYLPQCAEMCKAIAAKKRELETALAGATNVTATAEERLAELGTLRTRCQTQMLRHFVEVSQAMPPEQGQRYLAEMQRITLGFHERIEQSMSQPPTHEHGHH
ncbi:MAG: periplasmic heavy metal sensor [Verrucomicrobiota bacterium]